MTNSSDPPATSTAPTPEAHGSRDVQGAEPARPADQPAAGQPTDAHLEEAPQPDGLNQVKAIIEALLFAADDPLSRTVVAQSLPEITDDLVNRALDHLELEYSGTHRGIHLTQVAGGLQMRTNPDFNDRILQLYEAKPRKLSRAAMETLAIVAYQQPLTRADIEGIRGVDSSGVIRTIQDHDLVETIGRLDDLGRPHIYGTTERFLEFFGLSDLTDLPTLDASELEALEDMYADELAEAEQADPSEADEPAEPSASGEAHAEE